jgi:hypothetical protein
VPQARLDDLMVSWASDGGGVGPHFDSYDVFLLQAQGRRRWRWGRQKDLSLREGLPLKILDRFEPEDDQVLEPGDMLYLPPRYAHDGIADGECQTCSIGFRAPARGELARELLERLADDAADVAGEALYADAAQPAVAEAPGRIPADLRQFAPTRCSARLRDPLAIDRALGESLSEPKANVWFDAAPAPRRTCGRGAGPPHAHAVRRPPRVRQRRELARRRGRCALMRRLADRRRLDAAEVERASDWRARAAGGMVRSGLGPWRRHDMTSADLPQGRFEGREAFADMVRAALACAAEEGWREIILSDASFADWPLGERAVAESLQAWSRPGRKVILLARRYDEVMRRHARFVKWRQTWSHIIEARGCSSADELEFPSVIWSPRWVMQRLDPERCNGVSGGEPERRVAVREQLAEWLQKSSPSFPSTTLGL